MKIFPKLEAVLLLIGVFIIYTSLRIYRINHSEQFQKLDVIFSIIFILSCFILAAALLPHRAIHHMKKSLPRRILGWHTHHLILVFLTMGILSMLMYIAGMRIRLIMLGLLAVLLIVTTSLALPRTIQGYKNSTFHTILFVIAGYLIISATIYLHLHERITTPWSFIGFLLTAILFLLIRVDSRFILFLVPLFLGYCPFLLLSDHQLSAEYCAIYAFYLLTCGVALQLIETLRDPEYTFSDSARLVARINPFLPLSIGMAVVLAFGILSTTTDGIALYSTIYLFAIICILNLLSLAYQHGWIEA